MERQTKTLIILFLIAFLIRVGFIFVSPIKIWDEAVYANLGYDLSHNPFDYSVANNGWSDFIPSGGEYGWPKMGFRAPLLPYILMLFYFLKLDVLIPFFMPFIGALNVCFVYFLGKELFNEKVSLYSAILFSLMPLHVIYSAKILTDVLFTFFAVLTFLCFWKGYEKGEKRYKILFGLFLALTLLSRYTALWLMPVFLVYLLIKNKSFEFLKDKYLWYGALIFFAIILPWFIYGYFAYNNPLGPFIHGIIASGYWGGTQPPTFFFEYWLPMFSLTGFALLIAIAYILYKREFLKRNICLLLLWFLIFLGVAIYMPHKEDRFVLAVAPPIALLSGYFIEKIKRKEKIILATLIIASTLFLGLQFYTNYNYYYTDSNECFLKSMKFLEGVERKSVIVTDESAVVYFYTRLETKFYPSPWSYETLKGWMKDYYAGRELYVLIGDFVRPEEKYNQIKTDLDSKAQKVFECRNERGYSAVYKIIQ
jgi:4-amino-4-deoxy-L-arabinose transferase-like glycosyltransferase